KASRASIHMLQGGEAEVGLIRAALGSFSSLSLAQFRQRKAQSDGQNVSKKQKKKKKASNTKDEESVQDSPDIDQSRGDETSMYSGRRGAAATADFNIIRTLQSGEIVKDDQTYNIEVKIVFIQVNGCSFVTRTSIPAVLIREEEFGVGEIYSEHGMRHTETRLEMMENELAGKQQEIEELNKELEEMRAAYGTEGLQQLQEFEAAIKKRDDIITQLTTNLQQARKEKDETMREFLELTEQSQKLQIQFQHLQASETLRNTSHSCTAADLLQAKQQILTHQQQLEEQEYLLKNYQKKNEESEAHITLLQDRIAIYEMEKNKSGEYSNKKLQEKETLIEGLEAKIAEGERNAVHLFEKLSNANELIEELKEQIIQKNQEVNNVRLELSNCKQKERQCSDEIKQLMGTVEELQKRCHKDSQFETDIVQRMELETQRRLAQLQAELDEMHGQQLVQMKQELIKQHALEIDKLLSQQKAEMEKTLNLCSSDNIHEDQIYLMNITINDLNVKLQDANHQREKVKQDLSQQLEAISAEKSLQQTQIEDLFQELSFAREQTQRAKQTITSMECRLNEADKYQVVIEDLKAQLGSEIEFRKELEIKHEAEVTNYKIKLEMLEREKDAVLDRMAESQEAELERLRTQLLFSHEEELSKLKEDLQEEHRVNTENIKDSLTAHYKQQLDGVQNEMSQKIEAMQFEKDNLITKQNQLILEISKLKDLQQSLVNSKSEEMTLQIHELQKEIEVLRQEKKEKGTLEQEVQELQLKTELLEKEMREREDCLQEKCAELETQNSHLKDENKVLEDKLKHTSLSSEENTTFKDNVSCKSENLDLEKRIEKLIAENEQLTKQGIQLKEEIERQKNTTLFAEKKFEVNYQELQKEYACLLKVKTDLEDSKNKQEVEYKSKLKALTEELQNIQSNKQIILKTKSSVSEGTRDNKLCKAETFEVGEVIEKDTTELMEKLEVTQREKLELSLRLSDLSEQLKSKHSEICQLSEEVKSLKQEKEQVLSRCKELEIIIINNQTDINIIERKIKHSKEKAQSNATLATETTALISDPSNEFAEEIKVREGSVNLGKDSSHCVTTEESIQQIFNPEQQSLLDHLHQMTGRLAGETSLMSITQNENNQLQQQLDILKSEQTDLQLQMEAQRICLSLVYSAHVDQVREYLQAEKESALCSLKEELVYNHAQEMNELKKAHQLELQTLKDQQTGNLLKMIVIVQMSVAFAQQTELARMARQKEVSLSVAQTEIVHQEERPLEMMQKCSEEELDIHLTKEKKKDIKHEELKPLSKELCEESSDIPSLGEQFESTAGPGYMLGPSKQEMKLSAESSSQHTEFELKEILVSIKTLSIQLLLYEERLEDMRQELVRQYQEHQQATETVRQGHMQQMEREKENQEQLLAEIERLKMQLAESDSVENDSLVTERERMLLEELESLKKHSVPGQERLYCELRNSSTQTQSEKENQNESKEAILEDEEGRENPEETSSAILSKERHALQNANNRLLRILLEVVKTTVAVEETIGHHVLGLLDRAGKGQPSSKIVAWESKTEESIKPCVRVGYEKEPSSSYHTSHLGGDDISIWSGAPDEGLELTQHLKESSFAGLEMDPEKEELILNISSRLQAAVEKLLEAISDTSSQLEHAKVTQTELMQESFKRQQEATEFLKCQEELQERLSEETKAREQLALELSKAESLIDGYADEKAFLEKHIQEKIDVIDHLEQELLCTGNKLQELEAERQQIQEEKELLCRQKDAMKAGAGSAEQQLLEETEKLMKEKIEVQRQAEKEYGDLQKQVKALETDLEEQVNRFIEIEQEKNAELMDLRQQNQALEKQLEKTRKFLDEQAIDREHERDVFQQEIEKLEQQLKIPQRFQPISEHQTREVEQLTNHLKEKTDKCSELLLSKEQLQRDVQERNEEIEKLECRIRELEQALIISADKLQKVEERKQFGAAKVKGELPLEVQLQAEQEAVDRKEKEITNLEEQLEQFREELENKNEEVQQLHMQLEIQRKESTTLLQELEQENKLFKDEMERLGLAIQKSENTSIKDHHLGAGKLVQFVQEKEQKIDHLNEHISELQEQLENTTDNKVIEEKNEHIRELEGQIEYLKSDQERIKKKSEDEIDQLNEVIEKLQQELANIEQKVPIDFASFQEDTESLKYQLDTLLAEKAALEMQVENNSAEASRTKDELEETRLKMNQLKQEINTLKREHEKVTEKYKFILMKIDKAQVEDRGEDKSEKLEEGRSERTQELLENEMQLKVVEEKVIISNLEARLQQYQATIKEKDSELCCCYNQIEKLKEQAQAETEVLKKKIQEMKEMLEEKLAAALVSQAQLNAVQEHSKFMQEIQAVSKGVKESNRSTQTENLNGIAEEETESKLSVLTERLSEMENKLAKMQSNLELEKENVAVSQKEAKEKEKRLLELQQLVEEIKNKHKDEIRESPKQAEVQTSELTYGQEGSVFIDGLELEKIKAESTAAKEELSSYRGRVEKLQEELVVREESVAHLQEELHRVKDNLVQTEKKLANYVRKEKEIAGLASKKDVDKSDSVSTKKSAQIRKSSSRTDKTRQINSWSQTSQVLVKDAEIQIDLPSGCSSEEVAEIIREFTEKIEQMQELHAAEIMDMETRHISEAEALKREQFVAVQVLIDECNTLKEVIETLRAKEEVYILFKLHTFSFALDSSSDWGQGIYAAPSQGSDTVSEGMGDEGEASTDLLPKKIKGLLRAVHHEGVQVLSLSEFPYSERETSSLKQGPELWLEERKTFLSTISSLKDLITKMQLHREAEVYTSCESSENIPDWRSELLHAVQQVFIREQDILLAAFQTELAELGARDAVVLMGQLDQRLQEQGIEQRAAMDCLQNADRRSLLMEIQVLHSQMNSRKTNAKREQEIDPKSQEMLEYNMQQKQSQILEMQVELRSVKDRAAELQEQLNSERMTVAELKNELAQAKLELETTLKAQHKHFKDLETIRTEVKEKATELDVLKDTMANEQKKSRELQWALEKEKAKMERSEERGREELEDLKFSLEDQKQKNVELNRLLEQEKQLSSDLQQKIESQEALNIAQMSHEQGRNCELQILLETQKAQVLEMSSALEKEKELCAQLQSAEAKEQEGIANPSDELFKELQRQIDEKHDHVVELVSEMEKYKLESVQVRQQMEKEKQIQKKALQTEQDANILAQKKVHELESKVEDIQWQLGEKRQQIHKLQHETKKLQEIIQELQKTEQDREEKETAKGTEQSLNETTCDMSNERTRNWILQQKMEGAEANEPTYPTLMETKGGDLAVGSSVLDNIRQTLQNMSSKLKQLAHKAARRLQFETADNEDFIGVQNTIEDVLLQLQNLPGLLQIHELLLPPGASSRSFTEGLLRQNAELTGFVSRLSEEKNNLRNAVLKLEEKVRQNQQRGPCGDYSSRWVLDNGTNIDTLTASEREIWNREKLSLQKSLKQADAELSKLRAELRNEAFLRELGSESENAVLKRIYGKYLRAESFRKALIYQKKYLLLLLGGFQECEEATLALIARMGGQPSYTDVEVITHHSKGFTRFRSAVRVSIAISRMKFLVHRWHRVTGFSFISINRDGFSQNTGNEQRSDSFSGGLDLYGEQRHSSLRSRSDLESPRSPVNSQQRYHGFHADINPVSLACPQLQNYDPDRALTDYINRLEALQRRLGSSASYTQLHCGMRR
uniref:A-kinase anchoring protein 9 n=1 Tax=Crocodylus porosus TaxID=8502 RepID=A0A7M4F3W0_CROPO